MTVVVRILQCTRYAGHAPPGGVAAARVAQVDQKVPVRGVSERCARREQAVTYGRGNSREAMVAMSENMRGYRTAKMVDSVAGMPAFTAEQRAELSDE